MQLCYTYVDLVGSNRSLPTEHCSLATLSTSDPGVPLSSRKANRLQVPKKPDIWGMKKSQSTSNLIRDVPQRSSSQPFVPRPSHNTVDSGYNTVTGSTGNLHSRSVGSGAPIRNRQHESNDTQSDTL